MELNKVEKVKLNCMTGVGVTITWTPFLLMLNWKTHV